MERTTMHELTVMVKAVWYSIIVVVFNQTRHVGAMSKKQEKKKTPLEHWSPVSLIGIGVQHVSIVVVEEDLHHEN